MKTSIEGRLGLLTSGNCEWNYLQISFWCFFHFPWKWKTKYISDIAKTCSCVPNAPFAVGSIHTDVMQKRRRKVSFWCLPPFRVNVTLGFLRIHLLEMSLSQSQSLSVNEALFTWKVCVCVYVNKSQQVMEFTLNVCFFKNWKAKIKEKRKRKTLHVNRALNNSHSPAGLRSRELRSFP